MIRLPAGRAMTRSTICCTVCAEMTAPQLGQWGTPIRAKSTRR
jgi:hypothetical protein